MGRKKKERESGSVCPSAQANSDNSNVLFTLSQLVNRNNDIMCNIRESLVVSIKDIRSSLH